MAGTGACDATIRVGAYGRLMAGSLVDTMWGLVAPSNCVAATLGSVRRHDSAAVRCGPTRGAPTATPELPRRTRRSLPQEHALLDGVTA